MKPLTTLLFTLASFIAVAQTQTIKGKVVDAQADYPLPGATVVIVNSDPVLGAATDLDGNFKIDNAPLGRQTLLVQFVGYKTITLPNILVTAGKEVILDIKLEESVEKLNEIVISAGTSKDLPANDLAKVSARSFNLEETMRYSGGRNDVARLAASFAGVSAPNDSRNDIVVRGNSPTGLLWRIEGIPMPTTNHFNTLGTTGGPVNALNPNLLRSSDFLTGAFPAEYGNANAAVFDINFRNGNPDKHEFTAQLAAFTGLEFMAEGPFNPKNDGSYVASYRYGIASVAATGTNAIPYYQDFSYKVNLGNTKLGKFEIFGMGGLSSIDFIGDEIDENDLFANPAVDSYVNSEIAMTGISHLIQLNKTTYLKSAIGITHNANTFEQDNLIRNEADELVLKYRATNVDNQENRLTISTMLNKKFNAKWSLRAGLMAENYSVNFSTEDRDNRINIPDTDNDQIPDFFIPVVDINDNYNLLQMYGQAENKITDELTATFGLHSQYLQLNDNFIVEPRAAISWQFRPTQRISLAYGLHAQNIPAPILFFQEETSPGEFTQTNLDLEFMKSHHFVFAYDRSIGSDWRLKAETYMQYLYDIPVEQSPSSFSILNQGADFVFDERGSLVNDGVGMNYGLELTLEKFFSRGYYMLLTSSAFESNYEGSDGIERNTAFNNNLVSNLLFGKEWKFGKNANNAWTFDTKLTYAGGNPYTPIDLEATRANAGRQVLLENLAFSERLEDYFRLDVKFGVRLNSPKRNVTHQFFIDLQNITNRENTFIRRYNQVTDEINTVTQIGFFPDVMYRIQF